MKESEVSIGNNGLIKDPTLAKRAIEGVYRDAYRRGWRPGVLPGEPGSAQKIGLSEDLAEVYQRIDGRVLDQLAGDSELAKIRDEVIREIKIGVLSRN